MTLSTIPFDQFVQKLLYKVVLLAFYIFQSMTCGRAAASCNVQCACETEFGKMCDVCVCVWYTFSCGKCDHNFASLIKMDLIL